MCIMAIASMQPVKTGRRTRGGVYKKIGGEFRAYSTIWRSYNTSHVLCRCCLLLLPCHRERRKATVSAIVGAAFGAAGQRCMALSVAVLVGDAGDWAKDIAEGASKLKVNVPFINASFYF